MLCLAITTGQFATAAKLNFRALPEIVKENYANAGKPKEGEEAPVNASAQPSGRRATLAGKIAKFDYSAFVANYKTILSMWICRICSFTIAYAYDEYSGLIVLGWVLLSFIVKLEYFSKWSTRVYLPLFVLAFFYEYLINIQFLFTKIQGIFENIPRQKEYTGGEIIPTPIHPVEICGFVLNIIFMIVITRYQKEQTQSRNEFQDSIFKAMASDRRNFLWQLSFFVLQRIHLILLCSIFLVGMNDINIFYIGLLYFFMKYVSSLAVYRKSGSKLVMFTAFFVWIPYGWELVKHDFYNSKKPEDQDFFYKLMQMITLQKGQDINIEGADTFNSYMEVKIPFGHWTVLLLFVLLKNINNLFKTQEYQRRKAEKKGLKF